MMASAVCGIPTLLRRSAYAAAVFCKRPTLANAGWRLSLAYWEHSGASRSYGKQSRMAPEEARLRPSAGMAGPSCARLSQQVRFSLQGTRESSAYSHADAATVQTHTGDLVMTTENAPDGAAQAQPEAGVYEPQHVAAVEEVARQRQTILHEIKKVIVGQDAVIEELLIALFSRGHCLLVVR